MILSALICLALQAESRTEEQSRKMLYAYLQGECAKQFDARRKAVAELKTPEDVRRRQHDLRAKFIEALGGFPEKTPLNARVVGRESRDGYRFEKVIYESRPDHHVTAVLYLPEGRGPFPGVLVPCGHSDTGKAVETYQRACISMAKNGLAVLCYDPIGQGERLQLLDADGKAAIKGSTTEHTMTGIGSLLVGWSCASFRIWDGIRSIDYLASRPEVDAKRLGCTGNSGGGTLTSYLMALDERIVAAAPSCYVTTLERLFATIGPQDAEQNITGQVAFGMEHTDYVTMRAPRPTLICIGTQDYFDAQGAWTTFREAKLIYGMMGHGERVDLFEYNDKHGFSKPRREASMRWMRRWLLGKDDAAAEPDFAILKDAEVQCTASGQVLADLKGKSVFDLIAEREKELSAGRGKRAVTELRAQVRRLIALPGKIRAATHDGAERPQLPKEPATSVGEFSIEPGIRLPGMLQRGGSREGDEVLFVHGEGWHKAALESLEALRAGSRRLTAVDLRGMGGYAPAEKERFFGKEWKESFLSFHLNRPLLGQRVTDLLSVKACLESAGGLHAVGVGAAAPVVLHAAALDETISRVTLEGGLISWSSVARAPISRNQLAGVVPGALAVYDLPDLAAAIAPRPLTIKGAVDPAGNPVSQAELEEAYAGARAAYKAAGAEKNLVLQAAP